MVALHGQPALAVTTVGHTFSMPQMQHLARRPADLAGGLGHRARPPLEVPPKRRDVLPKGAQGVKALPPHRWDNSAQALCPGATRCPEAQLADFRDLAHTAPTTPAGRPRQNRCGRGRKMCRAGACPAHTPRWPQNCPRQILSHQRPGSHGAGEWRGRKAARPGSRPADARSSRPNPGS